MLRKLRYYLFDFEADMRHASAMVIAMAMLMVAFGYMRGQEVREDIAAGRVQVDLGTN